MFAAILGTGSCQATVVPQSLPIFKRFVTSLTRYAEPGTETSTQIRATLLSFLRTLKLSQQREMDAALACEKNTILTSTILLTSAPSAFTADDIIVKRFIEELFDCLGNRLTSKVASGCCRSLLLLPKKSPVETAIAAQILPQVLSFLANPSDVEGLEESRSALAQTLVAFISTLPTPEQRQIATRIVIPALLARVRKEPKTSAETAGRLLEVAGADQAAFRSVVSGLEPEERSFLETVLKSGQGQTRRVEREDSGEPTIALKMNFGV